MARSLPEFDRKKTTDPQQIILNFEWQASFVARALCYLPPLTSSGRPSLGYSEYDFIGIAMRMALVRKFFYTDESINLDRVIKALRKSVANPPQALLEKLDCMNENRQIILNAGGGGIIATAQGAAQTEMNELVEILINGLVVHGDIGKSKELRTWGLQTISNAMWIQWILPGDTPGQSGWYAPWDLVRQVLFVVSKCRSEQLFESSFPDPLAPVWGWTPDEVDSISARMGTQRSV